MLWRGPERLPEFFLIITSEIEPTRMDKHESIWHLGSRWYCDCEVLLRFCYKKRNQILTTVGALETKTITSSRQSKWSVRGRAIHALKFELTVALDVPLELSC